MTAVECVSALRSAVRHVFRLQGLSMWRKIQICVVKIVAIVGYHYGKFIALTSASHDAQRALRVTRNGEDHVIVHPKRSVSSFFRQQNALCTLVAFLVLSNPCKF